MGVLMFVFCFLFLSFLLHRMESVLRLLSFTFTAFRLFRGCGKEKNMGPGSFCFLFFVLSLLSVFLVLFGTIGRRLKGYLWTFTAAMRLAELRGYGIWDMESWRCDGFLLVSERDWNKWPNTTVYAEDGWRENRKSAKKINFFFPSANLDSTTA